MKGEREEGKRKDRRGKEYNYIYQCSKQTLDKVCNYVAMYYWSYYNEPAPQDIKS